SNLVRANINDILDHAEDPEKMLDQLVRDFTNAIHEAPNETAVVVGSLRIEEDDLAKAKDNVEKWGRTAEATSHKADEAEASGDTAGAARLNALAESALNRQISFEKQVETLTAKVDADT